MPRIYKTPSGLAAITVHGGALMLFSPKDRNDIIRAAAVDAGEMWQAKFLPQRFTKHVARYPFGYGNKGAGFITVKVRKSQNPEIRSRWTAFVRYNFLGWDPWNASPPPLDLENRWRKENPNEYRTKNQGRDLQLQESARLRSDLRRWAKKLATTFAMMLDSQGLVLPLVDSGKLRAGAGGARPKATSTTFKFTLRVPIPFPGPRNPIVPRILQTVPSWELAAVGAAMADTIASVIRGSSETFSRSNGGGVNRGYRIQGAQSRLPQSATGRSIG